MPPCLPDHRRPQDGPGRQDTYGCSGGIGGGTTSGIGDILDARDWRLHAWIELGGSPWCRVGSATVIPAIHWLRFLSRTPARWRRTLQATVVKPNLT
jgi:hypothetical protein